MNASSITRTKTFIDTKSEGGKAKLMVKKKIKDVFLNYLQKTSFDVYKDDNSLLDTKTSVSLGIEIHLISKHKIFIKGVSQDKRIRV